MSDRRPLDKYYTPDDVAERCVAVLDLEDNSRVIEPSAGGGAFVRALAHRVHSVFSVDIDPGCHADWVGDFLDVRRRTDWVIGNPPFCCAEEHILHALTLAPNVAFLLRLAMLESERRRNLWRDTPLDAVYVLARRPSFTGRTTDSAAYGFFVWRTGRPHVPWRGGWL